MLDLLSHHSMGCEVQVYGVAVISSKPSWQAGRCVTRTPTLQAVFSQWRADAANRLHC